MDTKKSEEKNTMTFAHDWRVAYEAGKICSKYMMLKLAASEVVAHYNAIQGDGDWCEPALKGALDYLDVICDAIDESEKKQAMLCNG